MVSTSGGGRAAPTSRARARIVTAVVIGAVAALLGLAPWLLTGGRLPLQNLWADSTSPEQMPRALLPFSQYAVVLLLALVVVGYGTAGVALRAVGVRRAHPMVLATAAALLVVHLVAVVQTTAVVGGGLQEHPASTLYLAALLAVVAVSVLVGLVVTGLVVARSRASAVIGLSVVATLLPSWLGAFAALPWEPSGGDGGLQVLAVVSRWLPALLVGASIALSGLASPGRLAGALGALVVLWVVPAGTTAVGAAAGSRALLRQPVELVDYGFAVLRSALLLPEVVLPPLALAVVVALVGTAAVRLVARRRSRVTG